MTPECNKGHNYFTWGCDSCNEKLATRIAREIYLKSLKKMKSYSNCGNCTHGFWYRLLHRKDHAEKLEWNPLEVD